MPSLPRVAVVLIGVLAGVVQGHDRGKSTELETTEDVLGMWLGHFGRYARLPPGLAIGGDAQPQAAVEVGLARLHFPK